MDHIHHMYLTYVESRNYFAGGQPDPSISSAECRETHECAEKVADTIATGIITTGFPLLVPFWMSWKRMNTLPSVLKSIH